MAYRSNLPASVCALALTAGTPALADAQSTKVLEEYFASIQSPQIVLGVGDKEDNMRSTQWNNITLKGNDGAMQIAIPWVKVSKNILGGFEMTYAQKIEGAFQSPDPKYMEPVRFVVESKRAVTEIGGDEGAREYTSTFDEITLRTLENSIVNVSAKITGGNGTEVMGTDTSSGSFDFKTMTINYDLEMDGEKISTITSMTDMTGKFNIPHISEFDTENPLSSFDVTRDMFIEFGVGASTVNTSMVSAFGPLDIDMSIGSSIGFLGVQDSAAILSGTSRDISYNVTATDMGMPPMQADIKETAVNFIFPLDNVAQSKPANYKIAINGMALSDQIWAMFDPNALLPRDEISLDIDLSADLRWLKKLAEIDLEDQNQAPPLEVDNATIKAFNLNVAGAELLTTGEMQIDNSQFPPEPEGTVNISLKGAFGLLDKLVEMGLIPAQYAMMAQGMSGVFFKPGDDGDDHLVSTIVMTKDGGISANGMPLK